MLATNTFKSPEGAREKGDVLKDLFFFIIIIKRSNQLSLPHQDDCNTRMNVK